MTRETILLFVDDSAVEAREGVVRTIHAGRKLGRPVLEPERPWEGQRIYVYGTIHYDEETQLFRMRYMSSLRRSHGHQMPEPRRTPADLVLYATSHDGVKWERPNLGLHAFDGSKENNIVYNVHSPSVIVSAPRKFAASAGNAVAGKVC